MPAAEERSDLPLKGIYWGCHNETFQGIGFTSFGDHFSRRNGLPDLLWRMPSDLSLAKYPDSLRPAMRSLVASSLERTVEVIGRMMLALRDGEKSISDLARAAHGEPDQARPLLGVMVALDFVTEHDGRYRAAVPVLTSSDEATTARVRTLGREVMERWLAANYGKMKSEPRDLSFMRSGVPFEDGFTMIWHYVFGITNRKLVEAGLFADPYTPGPGARGIHPGRLRHHDGLTSSGAQVAHAAQHDRHHVPAPGRNGDSACKRPLGSSFDSRMRRHPSARS